MKAVMLVLALAGCSQSMGPDSGSPGDAQPAPECTIVLGFQPPDAVAGPSSTIHVTSQVVGTSGVLAYQWNVRFNNANVPFAAAPGDDSAIDFSAMVAGIYDVSLEVTGAPITCAPEAVAITVAAVNADHKDVRLRVVSPPDLAAPVFEKTVVIGGGSMYLGSVAVDPGVLATPIVNGPGGVLAAYLTFSPNSAPGAIVEAFSDASGHTTTRLVPGLYTVLVMPSAAGIAPGRVTGWSASTPAITIAAGTPITGVVRGHSDAPIQGAKVQLTVDGVPSTVATTAEDGGFLLRAAIASGKVIVDVSPPAASALPRLTAASEELDLRVPLQIHYAPAIALKNLAGIRVERLASPLANVQVMVVGTLVEAGTVVTAGTSATAEGDVRIATRTDEVGVLPPTLVPSARLSAVVTVAAGDIAVAALDTRALPANLEAPSLPATVTVVANAGGEPLRGTVVDVVPTGALAAASAPSLQAVSDGAGKITVRLAAGGRYDLRFRDPAGRAAQLVVSDCEAARVAPGYRLPAGLQLRGTLMHAGTQALANASVQILCDGCVGLERARPIAEVTSDAAGRFSLAVPDPGTAPGTM